MATEKNSPTRAVVGPVRLSYAHLWEPVAMEEGQKKKYQSVLLIPKKDKKSIAAVKKAIEAAETLGKEKFGKKWIPGKLKECLHDGDVDKPEQEEYENMYYLTAKNTNQPNMIFRNGEKILDREEMYSGVWAFVSLNFFPYNNVSIGVGVSLNNLMKDRDDEPFSGQSSAEEDFADMIDSDGSEPGADEEEDFM